MFSAPHAATGALLGSRLPAWLAVQAALGSHFVLDVVPHWQEVLPPYRPTRASWVRVPLDLACAYAVTMSIARSRPQRSQSAYLCAALAILPDFDAIFFARPDWLPRGTVIERYFRWHIDIQRETSSFWGTLPQAAVVLTCWIVSRRLPAKRRSQE